MNNRFKRVKLYDNFKFCPTCPVDVLKGAIYIDSLTNKAVFQLKLVNMQDKIIKAIFVQIKGSNDLGELIENKEYTYLDLNIHKGQEFGTEELKELDNYTIRNIDVTINKVIYINNEVWKNKKNATYYRVNLKKIDKNLLFIANEKADKQRLQLNNIYYPTESENYWICICGAYNSNSSEKCYKCNCLKDVVFNKYSKDILEEDLIAHNKKEKEKKELKSKKIKVLKKICLALMLIIVIFFIIFYFRDIEYKKLFKYNEAIDKYNSKHFDEAITLFTDLKNYKDSNNYLENSYKGNDDLNIIDRCISYYEEQSANFYEQCKQIATYITTNQVEQYISELKQKGYYKIVETTYSIRETYKKQLKELKTKNFDGEKEILAKIDEQYTELYNYLIEPPKKDNYKDYINGANRIYKEIENYISEIKELLS